jgi:hypothetical protein
MMGSHHSPCGALVPSSFVARAIAFVHPPLKDKAIARGASLTSPRLRGEVAICALVAQIAGEGASPPVLNRKSELAETPPHPASGEREKKRRRP